MDVHFYLDPICPNWPCFQLRGGGIVFSHYQSQQLWPIRGINELIRKRVDSAFLKIWNNNNNHNDKSNCNSNWLWWNFLHLWCKLDTHSLSEVIFSYTFSYRRYTDATQPILSLPVWGTVISVERIPASRHIWQTARHGWQLITWS